MPDLKLAYLKVVHLAPHVYAGGLMVVDERGLPLDFRYTDPVTPSRVQQILYGKALERHVKQDVIFHHLADKIEPKPAFLLVDEEQLLGATGVPTVLVVETRLAPLHQATELQVISDVEYLLQLGETGSPLRFKFAKAEPGLADKLADALLAATRQGLEPTEPFGRVRGAVETLCSPSTERD
ncbi:MAG TPA: hypothetical protein V6D47_09940 [Oscillatoriaceae cyanobacterium]